MPKHGRCFAADPRFTFHTLHFTAPGSAPRTKVESVFSGLLEIQGNAAHDKAGIARHEMNVGHRNRFVAELGRNGKGGSFPLEDFTRLPM